ncbi:MAG: linear amide C-N hydrolase [Pseudobdellovibrionaceae bacterium]
MKIILFIGCFFTFLLSNRAFSCTGISLKAKDGTVVVARTVEWALSDAQHDRLVVIPRGKNFVGLTPEGQNGKRWVGKNGFVSLMAYGEPFGPDGLNEHGLYVGMYYLPGYAEYKKYDASQANNSFSVGDYMQWLLSSFRTVDEVRKNLDSVNVVNVEDKRFGGAPLPFHWKISDQSGKSIIVEMVNGGEVKVYDAFLGVITNSPTYDWHMTNMKNYLKLSPHPSSSIKIDNFNLSPLGGGSGMVGLPGDFTPPSRFIRAAAFTASCRPLKDSTDAISEAFRILDSFNIPLGAQLPLKSIPSDIVGATQVTSASDLTNRIYYYHSMHSRQVNKIDLKKINFSSIKQMEISDSSTRTFVTKDITPVQ